MKIKCAIFDFDGTLFDSMSIWDEAGEKYLRSLGKEPKPSVREDLRALSLYQAACYFQKEYGLTLSPDAIIAGINQIIEGFYLHEVLPKPGVIAFLEEMKRSGISLCIATASDRYLVEAALTRCEAAHFFDAIFTCSEIGQGKEQPIIFRTAMEYFHADRSTTVIFEDALHAIQTAKEDGFPVIAVFDPSEQRQEEIRQLCDCYLTDFEHRVAFWKFASAE